MVLTFVLLYVGGWAVTTVATFAVSRRLADEEMTPLNSLYFSLLAGLVWPLMIVGVVELSSMAVYSTAKSLRRDPGIPESWLTGDTGVVVPLR